MIFFFSFFVVRLIVDIRQILKLNLLDCRNELAHILSLLLCVALFLFSSSSFFLHHRFAIARVHIFFFKIKYLFVCYAFGHRCPFTPSKHFTIQTVIIISLSSSQLSVLLCLAFVRSFCCHCLNKQEEKKVLHFSHSSWWAVISYVGPFLLSLFISFFLFLPLYFSLRFKPCFPSRSLYFIFLPVFFRCVIWLRLLLPFLSHSNKMLVYKL